MRKVREVIRLKYEAQLSNRSISRACRVSPSTVWECLHRFKVAGLSWPLPDEMDDQALALLFYPRSDAKHGRRHQEPVWIEVHQALKQKV